MGELIIWTDVTFEEGGSFMCTECQPHLCQDLCWMHWILQNLPWIDFLFLSLQMRSRTVKRSRRMCRAGRAALGNWLLSQAQPGHHADLSEPREWPKAIYVRKSNPAICFLSLGNKQLFGLHLLEPVSQEWFSARIKSTGSEIRSLCPALPFTLFPGASSFSSSGSASVKWG